MKQFQIKEEKIKKLPVRFSQEIANEIEWINFRNFGNDEALSQWNDYIETIICYISDPVIAWDNMNRYRHNSYGETFIKELGMDVGFVIEIDNHTNKSFVYIFYLDLNIEEFGLKESKQRNRTLIITEQQYNELLQMPLDNVKDMRTNESKVRRNVIRLTESMLKAIIAESVNGILKEITLGKDSYQAKPKNGGRLNDWELMHILTTIVSNMISDKRVSKEDGEMLLHYALYNNDCYTHADS